MGRRAPAAARGAAFDASGGDAAAWARAATGAGAARASRGLRPAYQITSRSVHAVDELVGRRPAARCGGKRTAPRAPTSCSGPTTAPPHPAAPLQRRGGGRRRWTTTSASRSSSGPGSQRGAVTRGRDGTVDLTRRIEAWGGVHNPIRAMPTAARCGPTLGGGRAADGGWRRALLMGAHPPRPSPTATPTCRAAYPGKPPAPVRCARSGLPPTSSTPTAGAGSARPTAIQASCTTTRSAGSGLTSRPGSARSDGCGRSTAPGPCRAETQPWREKDPDQIRNPSPAMAVAGSSHCSSFLGSRTGTAAMKMADPQIRNSSVLSIDLHNNTVRSTTCAADTVAATTSRSPGLTRSPLGTGSRTAPFVARLQDHARIDASGHVDPRVPRHHRRERHPPAARRVLLQRAPVRGQERPGHPRGRRKHARSRPSPLALIGPDRSYDGPDRFENGDPIPGPHFPENCPGAEQASVVITDSERGNRPDDLKRIRRLLRRVQLAQAGAYGRPGRASCHSARVSARPATAHAWRSHEDGRMSHR